MQTKSYCSGERHGLGSNPKSGKGVESLAKCAEYSLSDSACDGTGYFDAIDHGNSYQCKCPENGACLKNTGSNPDWNIYQTTESGINVLDERKMALRNKIRFTTKK